VIAVLLLVGAVVLSLVVGARPIPPAGVVDALVGAVGDAVRGAGSGAPVTGDAGVVLESRLPRTLIALAAGAALGLAGALIQAVTRNPLADPGILGVTAGSAFAVALAVAFLGVTRAADYRWFAFAGAFAATVAVALIGTAGRDGGSPVRVTLAGVALGAVLLGITSAIVLADPRRFQAVRAWESGSLQGRSLDELAPVLPFLLAGAVVALLLGRALDAIALGDDRAAALGVRVGAVRGLAVLAVTLLAGGATAVAGPIAFLGLMVPHVARWITGPRWSAILALTLLLAPTLLLVSDVVGRVLLPPGEVPVGIVTAAVGAPVLIALVRTRRASTL